MKSAPIPPPESRVLEAEHLRSARQLVRLRVMFSAGFLLVMRFVDLLWTVAPALHHDRFHVSWMDLAAPIGIGGLWLWGFIRLLKEQPLLPLKDPRRAALEQAGGHP